MIENPGDFLEFGNLMWQTCIAEGITPREFGKLGVMPRPDSINSYIEMMKLGFNAGSANGLEANIQFNFSGENQGSCFLTIKDGSITGQPGNAIQPSLTVNTPFEVWMDIINRQGRRPADVYGAKIYCGRRFGAADANGSTVWVTIGYWRTKKLRRSRTASDFRGDHPRRFRLRFRCKTPRPLK